jgi:hypothetical protein
LKRPDCTCATRIKAFSVATYSNQSPCRPSKISTPRSSAIIENLESIDAFCTGKSEQVLKLFANYMLTKVYVVFVKTDSLKSAYPLFNVLNARGMSLSNADLIKNTLL